MELENLVRKIKLDIANKGSIEGYMYYKGETQDRIDGDYVLTFSYEFPQGKGKDFSKYDKKDNDIDEARADVMVDAKSLLDYHLKDNLFQIRFLEKSENSAKIEIYHDIKNDEISLDEIEDDLTLYLICERSGIDREESRNPCRYDKGHEEWLKTH